MILRLVQCTHPNNLNLQSNEIFILQMEDILNTWPWLVQLLGNNPTSWVACSFEGGGVSQIWFGYKGVPLWARKLISIFKSNFGRSYSFLRSCSNRGIFFTNFRCLPYGNSGKMDPCLGIFFYKMGFKIKDFLWKSDPLVLHIPVCLCQYFL